MPIVFRFQKAIECTPLLVQGLLEVSIVFDVPKAPGTQTILPKGLPMRLLLDQKAKAPHPPALTVLYCPKAIAAPNQDTLFPSP